MKTIQLKVKLLNEYAYAPKYSREGDAALGIFLPRGHTPIELRPGEEVVIKTGVCVAVPVGYVGKAFSRSGQGFKYNVRLANCTGIIDSNYRGELCVKLIRDVAGYSMSQDEIKSIAPMTITPGQEIAQFILEEIPHVEVHVVDELDDTNRGTAGFGSSDDLNKNAN